MPGKNTFYQESDSESEDDNLLDDKRSEFVKLDDDDDLQFLDMDEPKPRNTYDANQANRGGAYPDVTDFQPRNTCPESGAAQPRIQGLEEVAEMSEESDLTSHLSFYDREELEKTSSSSDSSSEQLNLQPGVLVSDQRKNKNQKSQWPQAATNLNGMINNY